MNSLELNIFSNIEDNVFATAYFGSRARGDFQQHSDYDIIVISPFENEGNFFFIPVNNIAQATNRVCIFYRTPDQALASISNVDEDWPVRNAPFLHNKIVSDPHGYFKKFKDTIAEVPEDDLIQASHESLYHAFEYLGKIKNNTDPIRTQDAARKFIDKLCKASAIGNRYIYKDYCNYYAEIEKSDWAPDALKENLTGIAGFCGWDANKIAERCLLVWDKCLAEAGLVSAHAMRKVSASRISSKANDSFDFKQ